MSSVRLATSADVPAIVAMGLRFIRETVYAGTISENPEQMARLSRQLIDGEVDGVLYVATDAANLPIGMVSGVRFDNVLSGDSFVQELFWWVSPEGRGSLGGRLKVALSTWSRERGALGIVWSAPTADVAAMYERRGMRRLETSFMERF